MGILYLVATPIGNLEDISARALRVLREVSLIAAEDTRQTGKLLQRYDIHTPLTSYHLHSTTRKMDQVVEALGRGDVALVSDAGTPALNDPGYELVKAALQAGYTVSPIPGPSAPIAALIASGLPTDSFLYLGYLPRKASERRAFLASAAQQEHTLIFLETPHRLLDGLQDMQQELGDREMAVARELTKLHEEIFRGRVSEALDYFRGRAPKGEFTLVVAGKQPEIPEEWTEARLRSELARLVKAGDPPSQVAKQLAEASGWPRREVYRMLSEADESGRPQEG